MVYLDATTIDKDMMDDITIVKESLLPVPKSSLSLPVPESLPALVLLGPAKAGTRTFVNTLSKYSFIEQFGREYGFWTSGMRWKCRPWWNETQWLLFINKYKLNKGNLSDYIYWMQLNHKNNKCNIKKYQSHYFEINSTKCQNITKCFWIEKCPIYSRTPWIPIIYANLLPKTKLITIIRNPINHLWSNILAFTNLQTTNVSLIEHWIIDEFKHKTFSFTALTEKCININNKYNDLLLNDERHSILMKTEYKLFVIKYLKLRFVEPKDIEPTPKNQLWKWSSFLLPNFLIGLLIYESELNIYNQFKIIQFEYIYKYTSDAMSNINCWITGICGKYDLEKDYLFKTVQHTNPAASSKSWTFTNKFANEIHKIFTPCNQTLINLILNDRRDLLIGDWINW